MDLHDHRSHLFRVVPKSFQLLLVILDLFGLFQSAVVLLQDGIISTHLTQLLLTLDSLLLELVVRVLNEANQHLKGKLEEVLRLLCLIEVDLLEVLVLWFAKKGSSFVFPELLHHMCLHKFVETIWLSRLPRSRQIGIINRKFYCCVKVLKLLVNAPIQAILTNLVGLHLIFLHLFACFGL